MSTLLALIALIVALAALSTAKSTRRELARLAAPPVPAAEKRVPAPSTAHDAPSTEHDAPADAQGGPVTTSAAQRPAPARPVRDLETFLGGRVMLVVGVLAVLFAVGFFLRYAITIGLLGPAARLGLSSAAGLVALFVGDRMRARGAPIWGLAVMGLGISTQFLVIWFAARVYGFLGEPLAMGLALLNTAVAVALAVKRGAPFLAHLGFLGGYLAPALLGTAPGAIAPWAMWLLVLDLGLLLIATRPGVRGLEPMALGATVLYFESWRQAWLTPEIAETAAVALGALVLAKLALAVIPAGVRKERPAPLALMATLGISVYGAVTACGLNEDAGLPLGLALLGLAAVIWSSLGWLVHRVGAERVRVDAAAFHLAGLCAVAAAVPSLTSTELRGPALAGLGLGAVWIGTSRGAAALRFGGVATLVWALVPLQTPWSIDPEHAFLNALFVRYLSIAIAAVASGVIMRRVTLKLGAVVGIAGTWFLFPVLALETGYALEGLPFQQNVMWTALVCAAMGLASVSLWRRGGGVLRGAAVVPVIGASLIASFGVVAGPAQTFPLFRHPGFLAGLLVIAALAGAAWLAERRLRSVLASVAALLGLGLLTAELFHHGELRPILDSSRAHARFVAQVAISSLWAIAAAVMIIVGFARRLPSVRWAALGLFAITTVKVFLHDTQSLEAVYRVGSFLALGLMLVGASLLYNRRRSELVTQV